MSSRVVGVLEKVFSGFELRIKDGKFSRQHAAAGPDEFLSEKLIRRR